MATVRFDWQGDKITQAIPVAIDAALVQGGNVLREQMRNNLSRPGPSAPGQPPGRQTSMLYKSIQQSRPANKKIQVGSSSIIGRWLERGVFITPKRAKYLAIPVNHKAKRLYARLGLDESNGRASLRSLGMKFRFVPSKKGDGWIMIQVGKSGKDIKNGAVFKLQKSSRILPRPWVRRSYGEVSSRIAERMQRTFSDRLRASLRGAARR